MGDIHITSQNQSVVLEDVHHPHEYMNKIQDITRDIKTDIAFPNKYRPEDNPGYHTKYDKK